MLCIGLVTWNASSAVADPIDPGFDLFSTPPFQLDLGPLGMANMAGDPIGPGNTDTIVERHTGLPDLGTGTIQIEIVALSLSSVQPIVVDIGEGVQQYDVHVGLDPSNPSPGQMIVQTHTAGGGTFDSFFDVFTIIELNPLNPSSTPFQMPQQDGLESQNSEWSHIRPPHYPENQMFPSGGFYAGVIPGTGIPVGLDHMGPHPHTDPSMPEPCSVVLLVMGAVGLGTMGRRRTV